MVVRLRGSNGELAGVLCLSGRSCLLASDDRDLLEAIASHAAMALENARLFTRIEQANRHWLEIFDAITDLIVVHDESDKVLRVNRSLAAMIGVAQRTNRRHMKAFDEATAPNTPPCILTILSAASVIALVGRAAAILQHQAFEAAVIGLAHGGVHADIGGDAGQHDDCRCRAVRSISSRSVAQNEPLPGLSMIGSPGSGARSGMISQPGSPRTRMRPHGPGIADAGADALRAPALVRRQIGEVGPMALARVEDVIALARMGGEQRRSARSGRR